MYRKNTFFQKKLKKTDVFKETDVFAGKKKKYPTVPPDAKRDFNCVRPK